MITSSEGEDPCAELVDYFEDLIDQVASEKYSNTAIVPRFMQS